VETEEQGEEFEDTDESDGIEVDKNLLTVDVTLPQTIVGDLADFNEEEYLAENEGIRSVEVNDDGSMSMNMTKKKHEELLEGFDKSVHESFEEIVNSEETPH